MTQQVCVAKYLHKLRNQEGNVPSLNDAAISDAPIKTKVATSGLHAAMGPTNYISNYGPVIHSKGGEVH